MTASIDPLRTTPEAPVTVRLTDSVGNVSGRRLSWPWPWPVRKWAAHQGVHASGYTWATPVLKIRSSPDLGRPDQHGRDRSQDEAGEIWYDTAVPLAHTIGAVNELWDLAEVVDELHASGSE